MNEIVRMLKLSSDGQLSLPKFMRDALGSEYVRVSLEGGRIVVEPLPGTPGSLKAYARPDLSHEEAVELAWQMAADDEARGS